MAISEGKNIILIISEKISGVTFWLYLKQISGGDIWIISGPEWWPLVHFPDSLSGYVCTCADLGVRYIGNGLDRFCNPQN